MLTQSLRQRLTQLRSASARPVILIDGGAGSGKTTLAQEIAADWPGKIELVSLDELYPGWQGLARGSAEVLRVIRGSGFTTWDWAHGRPGPRRSLNRSLPLVIEGCGAITEANRALAGLALWVELDEQLRRRRALARDGAVFASHWDEWAAQEISHWQEHRPWLLADLVLPG